MSNVTLLRERLQKRRGEWPDIAKRAGLSYWWVMKVGQGTIKEPGLSKADKLVAELDARDSREAREVAA